MGHLVELIKAAGVICAVGLLGFVGVTTIKDFKDRKELSEILDTDGDGKLSYEEIKKFYDETGVNPYSINVLNSIPITDVKKFLRNYELVYKKKYDK